MGNWQVHGNLHSLEIKFGLALSSVKIILGKHLAIEDDANATLPDKKEEEEEEKTMTITIFEEIQI
jgi:hypothetical protein